MDKILTLSPFVVYLVVAGLVFAEDALFVGFVLPGETAAILGGVSASRGTVSLAAMMAIVVVAAIVGDTVGYEVGRHGGSRLVNLRAMDKHRHRLADAQDLIARRGGSAVFLGRWTAFFRAVMPALAGTSGMPYRRFLAFNAAGGLLWGVAVVLLGFFAGNSYAAVEKALGKGVALAILLLGVVIFIAWRVQVVRRRRRDSPVSDG